MRATRVLRFLVLNGCAVALGAVVAASCVDVNYPTVAFRCNPRQTENCPESHFCCSDDPTAQAGGLPDYLGAGIAGGTPYFSGLNNGLGTSGMCVRTEDIEAGSGLQEAAAINCPVPCNPSWDGDDTQAVCGTSRACCQTVEIEVEDCIFDSATQLWRPANGNDIFAGASDWTPDRHATHQDPNGRGCSTFAGTTDLSNPTYEECLRRLTVADQRGFCTALAEGESCPTEVDGYLDACEQINAGLLPPPVAGS